MFAQRCLPRITNKTVYRIMNTRTFLASSIVALSLLSALATHAVAQADAARGGGRAGFLTTEQRTKLREAMQASQSDMTALTEKLRAAEKEALKAVTAKDADEKSVRPKLEAVAKIQTDIALLRLKAVKEVASTLTDEQKTQLESNPGMAYNALLGGFGGGMGGGRRGRGAGACQ